MVILRGSEVFTYPGVWVLRKLAIKKTADRNGRRKRKRSLVIAKLRTPNYI